MKDRADALRAALPESYWASKPSFERCAARAARAGVEGLTRDEFAALKGRRPGETRRASGEPHGVTSLEQLYAWTETTPEGYDLKRLRINAWSPDHTQVRADLEPKVMVPPIPEPRQLVSRVHGSDRRLRALIVPDTHVGHFAHDGRLEPLHDEVALELVHRVAEHLLPDVVVLVGDFLDLAGFSSYETFPAYRNVVGHALQTAYNHLARFRESCQAMVYLEGNHEARIQKYLVRGAPEAHGLTRAGETTPVMSLRHLLHLDALGIEYAGPYDPHYWFDGNLVMHGSLIGPRGGQSVAKHLDAFARVNTIFGHTHRAELAFRTSYTAGHAERHCSMNVGTLARRDGPVPGSRHPDWHCAAGLLWAGNTPGLMLIDDLPGGGRRAIVDGHEFVVEPREVTP